MCRMQWSDLRERIYPIARERQGRLAPYVASALIIGTANPAHLLADHGALQAKIPPTFWDVLRSTGMLHSDDALPVNKV